MNSNLTTRTNSLKRPLIAGLLIIACLLLYTFKPGISFAKDGVFLNNEVFFTLEEASLAKGQDSQSLQFRVLLTNSSGAALDYNQFGVKISTTAGTEFYAKLSEKADAVVPAYSGKSYAYIAKLAPTLTADQLRVTFFDRSRSNLELGSLSVGSAMSLQQSDHKLVFDLASMDASAAGSTFVAVQANRAFAYPTDGAWNVTLDSKVSVSGSADWDPANVNYALKDTAGHTYALTASTLETSKTDGSTVTRLLLSAKLDAQPDLSKLTLDVSGKTSSKTVGQIEVKSLFKLSAPGDKVALPGLGRDGLSVEVTKNEQVIQAGKKRAVITAVFHNDSTRSVANPALSGILVSKDQKDSLATETITGTEKYTAAGGSATYQFVTELPDKLTSSSYEFYISEKKTAASASVSQSSAASAKTVSASTSTASGATTGTAASFATSGSSNTTATSSASASGVTVPLAAFALDNGLQAGTDTLAAPGYTLGQPFVFTADNEVIDDHLEVSLVDLTSNTNVENGYRSIVAKFKFVNKGQDTLSLPELSTELQDASGKSYPGAKQKTTLSQLIPDSAYVYSYAYLVPPTVDGTFKLSILDTKTTALKLPIASYRVTVQSKDQESTAAPGTKLSVYPYSVDLRSWYLGGLYNNGSWSYKLTLDLNIVKDAQVITDDALSKLEFELVDKNGRALGSSTFGLQGTGKLVTGLQTMALTNVTSNEFNYPLNVKVYETVETANGVTRRLLTTLKQ